MHISTNDSMTNSYYLRIHIVLRVTLDGDPSKAWSVVAGHIAYVSGLGGDAQKRWQEELKRCSYKYMGHGSHYQPVEVQIGSKSPGSNGFESLWSMVSRNGIRWLGIMRDGRQKTGW